MPMPHQRSRHIRSRNHRPAPSPDLPASVTVALESRWWDRALTWLVGIAQIVLVFLGYITYQYTLVPLYKQAALENESARLSMELDKLKSEKEQIAQGMAIAAAELTSVSRAKAAADDALALAEREAERARVDALQAKSQAAVARAEAAAAKAQAQTSVAQLAVLESEGDKVYLRLRREVLYAAAQRITSCIDNNDASIVTIETCIDGNVDERSAVRTTLRVEDARAFEAALHAAAQEWAPRWVAAVTARSVARRQARDALAQLRSASPPDNGVVREAENQLRALEVESSRERTALFAELFGRVRNLPQPATPVR